MATCAHSLPEAWVCEIRTEQEGVLPEVKPPCSRPCSGISLAFTLEAALSLLWGQRGRLGSAWDSAGRHMGDGGRGAGAPWGLGC